MQKKHLLEYIALRIFCFTVKALPVPLTIRAGRKIGLLATPFIKKRIELAHSNLQIAFGDTLSFKERNKIIRSLLSLLGEGLIESIVFNTKEIEQNITVEGMELLENALAMKKGAIILGPHFGQWELAGFVFGSYLKNASTVYKSLKNPFVNSYLIKKRQESNLTLIQSKNGLRQVFASLKKGSMVVILFDQNAGRDGLPVNFFGSTAFTYSAPAVFALKTGCPVLPAYTIKDSGFRKHRLVIKEPFPLIRTGDKEKDLMANTQQYNDFIESLVRKHPDQWFGWLHNRWKIPGTR